MSGSVDETRRKSVGAFVWMVAVVGFLSAAAYSTLNALLDTHPPKRFKAIITDTHCYRRGNCYWDLVGAPALPAGTKSITVSNFLDPASSRAEVGDSVFLVIQAGAFGREWIASRNVRHVERSLLPCARLARAATAGDTVQLGELLGQGLLIESAEPALGCQTPLMTAAKAGQVAAIQFLLRRGADPNHATPDGETALMNAVTARSLASVRLLLTQGADPKAVTHAGGLTRSVMGIALEVGDTNITRVVGTSIPRAH